MRTFRLINSTFVDPRASGNPHGFTKNKMRARRVEIWRKDGQALTAPIARGKMYPYSSTRQATRQGMQETNIPPRGV